MEAHATTVTSDDVMAVLNGIVDPCSITSGCPAGLVDMGLVRNLDIGSDIGSDFNSDGVAAGTNVRVTLTVTHPFCMMSAVFVNEARIRLGDLPGVAHVDVELDTSVIWTDDDLDPDYAERRRRSLQQRGITLLKMAE
jgi:metal-sulfur cluster biosynthetic enzyme